MRRLPIITTSEIKTFQRCKRLHHYKYGLGYRPVDRPRPLAFGSVVHAGLEQWWATAGDMHAVFFSLKTAQEQSEVDSYDLVKADVMLSGYNARWINEPIEVISVEQQFTVPIIHPVTGIEHHVQLAGKTDAVCRMNGRVFIPEHKTRAEGGDLGYFEALRGDMQVSNYLVAMRRLGYAAGGALYDVLVKPPDPKLATPEDKRRYRKDGALYANQRERDESPEEYRQRISDLIAADPDAYYQRFIVTRLDEEIESAELDLWHMADEIFESHSRAYHPRNPSACHHFGRACAFFDVCFGAARLDDSTRFTQLDNPHQELEIEQHATSNAAAE